MPICLDKVLRCACNSWVRVCRVLRSASRGLEVAKVDGLAAAGQTSLDGVELGAEELDVEHDAPALG